jgi:hypothetical protein
MAHMTNHNTPSQWLKPTRIRLVALALACQVAAAQGREMAQALPPMRVDAAPFEASAEDILAVCQSAAKELVGHFPEPLELEPISIRRDPIGPLVAFQRTDRGEVEILLNTGGTFWSQYAYQFAHEFCHLLCGFHPDNPFLWFEEVLCETASLFAMRAMARSWKDDPPYENWRDYRDSLSHYVDDVITARTLLLEIQRDGLATFYTRHRETLHANPNDRERNGAIAALLLPHFEKDPARWEAVRWLYPSGHQTEGEAPGLLDADPAVKDFEGHLNRWHQSVPERHRAFVGDLIDMFGLDAG